LSSSATNIGASNVFTVKGRVPTETAKEMTIEEIKVTIEDHVHAAKCAIEAGFDAVEIVPRPSQPPNSLSIEECLADKR
jgi:N-ethylmaleimide reductase